MIVRTLADIRASGQEIKGDGWISRRYLLKKDRMGFSFHETIIPEGASLHLWYQNHLEAVYCVSGKGKIFDKSTNSWYDIEPGTLYALDKNDPHNLVCSEEMRLLCTFNPPCVGKETHDASGSYPLLKTEAL